MSKKNQKYNQSKGTQQRNSRQRGKIRPEDVISKEALKSLVIEYIDKERQQMKESKRDVKVMDCSDFDWDDFEEKFCEIEDGLTISDGKAKPDDFDITVYTDAWDPRRIFEFCMIYWNELNIEEADIRRDNIDILSFSCYYTAMAELFLAGQDALEGIDGHTRDSIRWAKHELKRRKIPEFIGDMFLGLRSIVLPEQRVRIVLLPHKVQTLANADIADNQITIQEVQENREGQQVQVRRVNCQLRPALLIRRDDFGLPQAAVNVQHTLRMDWNKAVLEFLDQRAVGAYQPREMNLILGYNHLIKRYAQCTLCANIQFPIHFTHVWYDFWLNFNADCVVDKWASRLFIGFGNEFMYHPRLKTHIPCQAVNEAAGQYVWMEEAIKEQWIPWIMSDTRDHLNDIITTFADQIHGIRLNRLHQRNISITKRIEYARRMSDLVRGATRSLADKPP